MKIIRFGQDDTENVIAKMTEEEIDNLPFGAIQLDATGRVITFNAAEAQITGRDAQDMLDRNFFTEVAPCTDSPDFAGVFRQGVANGKLKTMFEYTFDHEMTPTRVVVEMRASISAATFWIFVKRA